MPCSFASVFPRFMHTLPILASKRRGCKKRLHANKFIFTQEVHVPRYHALVPGPSRTGLLSDLSVTPPCLDTGTD